MTFDESISFDTRANRPGWVAILRSGEVAVFVIAVASRLLVFGLALLLNQTLHLGRQIGNLMCTWDCGWYLDIVEHGYWPELGDFSQEQNWAFFPLFPAIGAGVAEVSGLHPLAALTLVSNVAFCIGLVALYRYLLPSLGAGVARNVAVLMAFSPYSFYFSAPYTEAVYFMMMALCLMCANNGRWIAAGLFGACLSATRNLGVFIVVPMLVIGLVQIGWRDLLTFRGKAPAFWLGVFLAPLGLFLYMYYLHLHVGDALAFMHVQKAWGREIGNPAMVLWNGLAGDAPQGWDLATARVHAIAGIVGLSAAGYLFWRRRFADGLVLLIGVLIPLAAGLQSMPRFVASLFPVYVALGLLITGRPGFRAVTVVIMTIAAAALIYAWLANKVYIA